jgi:hypothetical protein
MHTFEQVLEDVLAGLLAEDVLDVDVAAVFEQEERVVWDDPTVVHDFNDAAPALLLVGLAAGFL